MRARSYLWIKVLVGLIGLALSVVLHELFHVLMHWGEVSHVNLFPNNKAIAEVSVWLPQSYDLEGEEMAAYFITLLVILATVIMICKIHDASDKRSAAQILFPKDTHMHNLHPVDLIDLTDRASNYQLAHKK